MLNDTFPSLTYAGQDSPAAPLDARFKILAAVAAAAGVLIAGNLAQMAAMALLIGLSLLGARVSLPVLWANIRPILLFLVVGGAILAITTSGAGWQIGPLHASRSGVDLAARLCAQLLLLLMITTAVTYTTAPLSIANALRRLLGFLKWFKVPVEDMATMFTIAITFLPIMAAEVDRYLTARRARGAKPGSFGTWSMLGEMLVPLIRANLERGDELALALETRLYGYYPRTYRLDAAGVDKLFPAVFIVCVIWVVAALVFL